MNKFRVTNRSRVWRNAALVLVLAVLAVASGVRDLDNLRQFTGFGNWASNVASLGTASAHAHDLSHEERLLLQSDDQFKWSGRVAQGKSIEIKGVNGSISAERASGNELEVIAIKSGRRSDPSLVNIKVIEHAGGVTICAVYPSDDPGSPNGCEPGRGNGRMNVNNNDVKVAFKVRVPAGVSLVGRTVNGEISALELAGNVDTNTVNGSINISTSGYARARTVNGDITAKFNDASWSGSIDFNTVNGTISIDLPAATNSTVDAGTSSGEVSSDFQLTTLGTMSRKRLSGTIGAGGREMNVKTVNGDIRLRKIG